MGFETPSTPEEMAKIQSSRALSDAELIKSGEAEYVADEKGNLQLHVDEESARDREQQEALTTDAQLMRKIKELPPSEREIFEAYTLALELDNLRDAIKNGEKISPKELQESLDYVANNIKSALEVSFGLLQGLKNEIEGSTYKKMEFNKIAHLAKDKVAAERRIEKSA